MKQIIGKLGSIILVFSFVLLLFACSNSSDSSDLPKSGTNSDYELSEENIAEDEETGASYVNNIVIVYFKDGTTDSEKQSVVDELNGEVVGQLDYANQYQIQVAVSTREELESICSDLMSQDFVEYSSYDFVSETVRAKIVPNDPWDGSSLNWGNGGGAGAIWGQYAVDAPKAWGLCSDNETHTVVGVVDQGIDEDHKDLEDKVTNLAADTVPARHGTHVAGIIGATGNNNTGIAGMDWNAELLGYDCFNGNKSTTTSKMMKGLMELVRNDAKVVNYSLGLSFNIPGSEMDSVSKNIFEKEAKDASYTMGKLLADGYDFVVVQAAGNGADDNIGIDAFYNGSFCSVTEDNCFSGFGNVSDILDRIIIVGNAAKTGLTYSQSLSSNGGSQVSIFAPGTSIVSTVVGGGLEELSGTSMAAPFVSGIASMVWSEKPSLSGAEVKQAVCDPQNTKYAVQNNPDNYSNGAGRLVNAYLAVKSVSADEAWKEAYINYLNNTPLGYEGENGGWNSDTRFALYDVDGDGIPEMERIMGVLAEGSAIVTYHNGVEAKELPYGSVSYDSDGTIWTHEHPSRSDYETICQYSISNSHLTLLHKWEAFYFNITQPEHYVCDGESISKSEFDRIYDYSNNDCYSAPPSAEAAQSYTYSQIIREIQNY